MTPSIDQTLHQFANFLPNCTLLPILTLLSLCREHSWRVRLANQETLTPPGRLVSLLVCRGPWMSTVVLYCWCHSGNASVPLYFTLLPNFGGSHRTLQRVRLANRGCLLLRTPAPVPIGTCMCSDFETIFSWTCHVYGPFEFWTSLGTSILLKCDIPLKQREKS